MWGKIITEPSNVTADNFVDHLASDKSLVHFFNEFLSLPSFPQALTYNQETGVFEAVSDAAESVSRAICSALVHWKSKLMTVPSELPATVLVDNRYSVLCLDREQGLQWILKERLPFFIQSDCYFEYKLAKLLSQTDPSCLGLGGHNAPLASVHSPMAPSGTQPPSLQRQEEEEEVLTPPHQGLTVYLTEAVTTEHCHRNCQSHNPPCGLLEHLSASLVAVVLKEVGTEMDSFSSLSEKGAETTLDCCIQSNQINVPQTANYFERGVSSKMGRGVSLTAGGRKDSDQDHDLEPNIHGVSIIGSRQGLKEFKVFLRGTPGEKLLDLWMDIERLRTIEDNERKHRHLTQMRQCYLLSGTSEARLSVELLSRLGLATTPSWREDKLHLIQPCITQALLLYWGPRFRSARSGSEDCWESGLSLQEKRQLRPPSGIDPSPRYITLRSLRPDTRVPPTLHPQPGGPSSSSPSPVLGGWRMERMLQALHVDSQAGHFFTGFCESSGNQLWYNAALCWWDLQQYHRLFYQDGLDPYRVQRLAQLLYSTYLCSAARRGVGVAEGTRREVYRCLSPAFEELFDGVEEHVLTLLLEPWTLLLSRDTHCYQQVCMQEETRQVASEQYRELQTLYKEAEQRHKQQVQQQQCTSHPPPPEGPRTPDPWASVPERYRGYRLGSLLRHHMELHHFLSFLQEHSASIHLTCWLDIDQLRRTPQKDKVTRDQRSKDIKTKYLNRKYFFGTGSPASAEQQDDVVRLAGGWGRLQHDRLPGPLLVEVQSIIRAYLEREWLPHFLSTPPFSQRQTLKPQTAASDQAYRRQRKKREVWKAEGSRMSSSQEVLALRRALLHPTTCLQFQRFVSLKGDFLENDVLFWLEVQRYKDLCHSHCEEAVVQSKVSTIISCFLHSSVPPAVQVDVPPEQVHIILDRRAELGPYIFREAQMSVFSELLKLWPQFQVFRSSVEEEQVLPLLEKRRMKQRERLVLRRRTEKEERRAQVEGEREEHLFEGENEEGEEQEDRHTEQTGRQSRELAHHNQQLAWSYSMYMTALEREELLLKRHVHSKQGGASVSTISDSSSSPSGRSEVSWQRRPQGSDQSPRTDSGLIPKME